MERTIVMTQGWFDGERHRPEEVAMLIESGMIQRILRCDREQLSTQLPAGWKNNVPIREAAYVMPGLVEAHCHLLLDGGELNFKRRSDYLKSNRDTMLATGRNQLAANLNHGITLIRDAGDIHGVNHQLREEISTGKTVAPTLRSPGVALRKKGRYGSFMAREVADSQSIAATVEEIAETADDLKIVLTGIIDFEHGCVKGQPQFDREELDLIVNSAQRCGRSTFAHCSGEAGLNLAVDVGVDSIEHGFFMTEEILHKMADKYIAWVPTFSPVHFQWAHPELAGWNVETVGHLARILDRHRTMLELAARLGVPLIAGSDAGSYGVKHGAALLDEIVFMNEAGVPLELVLRGATSLPRETWNCQSADIAEGNKADLLLLAGSPFDDPANLRELLAVYKDGWFEPENQDVKGGKGAITSEAVKYSKAC
jgi:imidazolonepropionase-like amidohydrolase